ncbi:MAG: hypothetical protein IT581_12975 [Verrucomicrobiales bacterium]|nr:hypothetical protein [Verrucomicrobiales bacterium]
MKPPWIAHLCRVLVLLSAAIFPGIIPLAHAAPALNDAQGMMKVDGQSRLVLGLYENPESDADLEAAVRNGFNLFQCPPDTNALNRLHRLGAKAWVNVGDALDLSVQAEKRRQRLTDLVQRVGQHPALLVWEGPDEILWNQWWGPMETLRDELRSMRSLAASRQDLAHLANRAQQCLDRGLYPEFEQARAEFWQTSGQPCLHPQLHITDSPDKVRLVGDGVSAGLRLLRDLDPAHLRWLNHAPRNALSDLKRFNREADIAGCDIYPAPANLEVGHSDLTDMTLASVGSYTRRMREAAPGKTCAMVLQGFGWRDLRASVTEHQTALGIGRPPTFRESRFMAYDALLNGANAILYWGTAYAKPTDSERTAGKLRPQLWTDLLRVARELRTLEPALVAKPQRPPRLRLADTFGSLDRFPLLATLRQAGDDWVLIVANESGHGLRFTVEGMPRRLASKTLHRLGTTEQHEVDAGQFDDGILPYDVHVYATSRRFEAATPQ